MILDITNNGPTPVPVYSKDEGGWMETLATGVTKPINNKSTVAIIGDKPDFIDQVAIAAHHVADLVRKLLGRFPTETPSQLSVTIQNHGPAPVRVIPGDVANEKMLSPGGSGSFTGTAYIELREMATDWNPVEQPVHGSATPN